MAFTISGTSGLTFPDSTTMTTGSQACKAWVNFNSSTIRSSFNVSSITVNGTGQYTVNFSSAMPDANYATLCTSAEDYANLTGGSVTTSRARWAPTTTSVRVKSFLPGTGDFNVQEYNVAVFR